MFLISVLESIGFIGLFYIAFTLVVAITVHEFAHAITADWLGDPLPRSQGRITLNPLAHLDPLGSILFLVAGFGWGRPVLTQPWYYRNGVLTGGAMVAAAGPLSNLVLAIIGALVYRVVVLVLPGRNTELFFFFFVNLNALLLFFNLLPIPPLDGYKVLLGLLPREMAAQYQRIEPYGFFILLALVFFGSAVFNAIIYTPTRLLTTLLLGS